MMKQDKAHGERYRILKIYIDGKDLQDADTEKDKNIKNCLTQSPQ